MAVTQKTVFFFASMAGGRTLALMSLFTGLLSIHGCMKVKIAGGAGDADSGHFPFFLNPHPPSPGGRDLYYTKTTSAFQTMAPGQTMECLLQTGDNLLFIWSGL